MRGANLGVGHVVLHQLRDAQVPELDNLAGHAQHVRRLHVAVEDLLRVERLEAPGNLDEVGPDEVLGEKLALSLALAQRPERSPKGAYSMTMHRRLPSMNASWKPLMAVFC